MRGVRGRDQEKVGRKKEELWGRRCSAWFVIALWPLTPRRGPCERWRGRLNSLSERLLYMSDYVCNDTTEDRQWSTTQDLFFHRWAENPVISLLFFLSFFLPKHCDCICERLHPILYLCNATGGGSTGVSPSSPIRPALILLETSTFTWWIFYQTLPVSSSESSRMLF